MKTSSYFQDELCPDCGVVLPKVVESGAAHPYIGASSSCWQLFSYLLNAGEPPVASGYLNPLLLDAYCVQHHGIPSPQAINSVAVHALVLYGVFVVGANPSEALWMRRRALRDSASKGKHDRFHWLEPPELGEMLTIVDIVNEQSPTARSERLQAYVKSIWEAWSEQHDTTLARWYSQYVE